MGEAAGTQHVLEPRVRCHRGPAGWRGAPCRTRRELWPRCPLESQGLATESLPSRDRRVGGAFISLVGHLCTKATNCVGSHCTCDLRSRSPFSLGGTSVLRSLQASESPGFTSTTHSLVHRVCTFAVAVSFQEVSSLFPTGVAGSP